MKSKELKILEMCFGWCGVAALVGAVCGAWWHVFTALVCCGMVMLIEKFSDKED